MSWRYRNQGAIASGEYGSHSEAMTHGAQATIAAVTGDINTGGNLGSHMMATVIHTRRHHPSIIARR